LKGDLSDPKDNPDFFSFLLFLLSFTVAPVLGLHWLLMPLSCSVALESPPEVVTGSGLCVEGMAITILFKYF
jgi:hypothetical protein